jgi:predicted phosphate transport protein (TIGR00153 family)
MKGALSWLSYRESPGIPPELKKDFAKLVDSAIDPIDTLNEMLTESRKYFNSFSEKQRVVVKDIISILRQKEHDSDQVEHALKQKIFSVNTDPVTIFHALMLAEKIGDIADHVENAGDMMRAMVAR